MSLGQTGGPLKQRTPTAKCCLVFSVVIWIYVFFCRFDSVSCLVDLYTCCYTHGTTRWMKDKTDMPALLLERSLPKMAELWGHRIQWQYESAVECNA